MISKDNYINELSILGMMNSNASLASIDGHLGFYKNKAHSKVAIFGERLPESIESSFEEISYSYLDNPVEIPAAKQYKMEQIRSVFTNDFFEPLQNIRFAVGNIHDLTRFSFENHGLRIENFSKKREAELVNVINRHRFNHRSKFFDIRIELLDIGDYCRFSLGCKMYNDVIALIEEWRYTMGYHYRFQEHAGIDKAFFKRYAQMSIEEKSKYNVLLFYSNDKYEKLLGYSVIEREPTLNENNHIEYKYLLRKTCNYKELGGYRNLSVFIDMYTFEVAYYRFINTCRNNNIDHEVLDDTVDKDVFVINWGCSSGGVAKYKKSTFPVYDLKLKYFAKLKKH